MRHDEPERRQTATNDYTCRLLSCVAAVARLPSPWRPGELARRLAATLSADAAAVERLWPDGSPARLATAGRPPPDGPPRALAIHRRVDVPRRGTVGPAADDPERLARVVRTTDVRGAGLISTWTDGPPATVLRVWRAGEFGDADVEAVARLHPHVGPMLAGALPDEPSGVTADVLRLLLEGLSEKAVADRLGRSTHTVHGHVKCVYELFGVNSRAQLAARCWA